MSYTENKANRLYEVHQKHGFRTTDYLIYVIETELKIEFESTV